MASLYFGTNIFHSAVLPQALAQVNEKLSLSTAVIILTGSCAWLETTAGSSPVYDKDYVFYSLPSVAWYIGIKLQSHLHRISISCSLWFMLNLLGH